MSLRPHANKNRIPVGLQPTDLFRGESRDPFVNRSVAGGMDPGFRRECGSQLYLLQS